MSLPSSTICANAPVLEPKKKKIIVFSCDGGGGHTAASRCLTSCLTDHDVETVNVVSVIGTTIDPLRFLSRAKYSGEDVYNYFLRNQWTWSTNFLVKAGKTMINLRKSRIKRKIARYVEREKPDMIVSVMPLFNYALYDAAVRYDIPFLVLTTDLDTKNYVHGLKKPSYKKFRYSLAFNDPMLEKKIRKANIDPKYIVYPGFPVRTDFFEEKNNDKIYEKFGLPRDRPIILLVMGACGSSTIIRYAKEILSIDHPLHLVACVGRNKRLKKKIEKIKIKGPATVTALGFTREISDLMSISSLLVSKPGPTTVCEAVQMKLPLLLDHTSGHLDWEKMNIDFVQKNNFGGMVSRPGKIKDRVSRYLFDKPFYSKIKSNLANYQPNKFPEKIRSLVDEMLSL